MFRGFGFRVLADIFGGTLGLWMVVFGDTGSLLALTGPFILHESKEPLDSP